MLMSLCVDRIVHQVSPVLTHVSDVYRQVGQWQVGLGGLSSDGFPLSVSHHQAYFHESKAEFPGMQGLLRSSLVTYIISVPLYSLAKASHKPGPTSRDQLQISFQERQVQGGASEEGSYYFNQFTTVSITIMIIKWLSKQFKIIFHQLY